MAQKKSKTVPKRKSEKGLFEKHPNLKWSLLVLLILFVVFLVLHYHKEETKLAVSSPNIPTAPQTMYKTYTNKIGTVTIQYPATWTVKEIHTLSNREVDNPDEINTSILSGKEGKVVIEWGPMGFGGGCGNNSSSHYEMFAIQQNTHMKICNSIINDESGFYGPKGSEVWGPFDNGHNDDTITEINGVAYPTHGKNTQTVKAILSSIKFN